MRPATWQAVYQRVEFVSVKTETGKTLYLQMQKGVAISDNLSSFFHLQKNMW